MMNPEILIVGAGINGLVAANYLQRSGCSVTMIDHAEQVGGACISEVATVDGVTERYALGASVLGLMQDFVFEETGLSSRLQTFVPQHPKFVHFPGDKEPAWIYRPERRRFARSGNAGQGDTAQSRRESTRLRMDSSIDAQRFAATVSFSGWQS